MMMSRRGLMGAGAGFGLATLESTHGLLAERVRHLETLEHEAAAAGGWPILTVAASNATAQAQADADWICDGVDDQVEIQAALDANHAAAGEQDSTVYLTEGTFNLSAAVQMYSYSTLWGSGGKTWLRPQADQVNVSFNLVENAAEHTPNAGLCVRDLVFYGRYGTGLHRGIYWDGVIYSHIYHNQFADLNGPGIFITGSSYNDHILDCELDGCCAAEGVTEAAIELAVSTVQNVYMVNLGVYLGYTVGVRMGGTYCLLNNSGIWANSGGNVLIDCDRNQVQDCYLISGTGFNLSIDGSLGHGSIEEGLVQQCIVTGNKLEDSTDGPNLLLHDVKSINVTGNQILLADHHGIDIQGAVDCLIVANHVLESGQHLGALTTYDNICIDVDSDYNCVQANLCRRVNTVARQTRYGINVANANCDGNMVTNNDLYNGGVTGNFNDSGTGTVTAAGNRV